MAILIRIEYTAESAVLYNENRNITHKLLYLCNLLLLELLNLDILYFYKCGSLCRQALGEARRRNRQGA